MGERQKIVHLAKLADQAERYEDVVDFMKKAAKLDPKFTSEEQTLLIGCKQMIYAKRNYWNSLMEQEEKDMITKNRRQKLESEITDFCNDIISLIDEYILPLASNFESSVYYYKMKADFYRYLAEIKVGDEKKAAAEHSMEAYETGFNIAKANLDPTNKSRLNLVLNFSVFYYEIMNLPERACCFAKQAFDEAYTELDNSDRDRYLALQAVGEPYTELDKSDNEQSCRYAILIILKLIEGNIKSWSS